MRISPHFSTSEFACPCCGFCPEISPELLDKLERLRTYLGAPIIITSGYRCERHNSHVGGASRSQHLLGTAADIKVGDIPPDEVAKAAELIGFNGIGVYSTWTHVDVRQGRARWRQ